MQPNDDVVSPACGPDCGCHAAVPVPLLPRRRFLQMSSLAVAAMAGPFTADDFSNPIPRDKKLSPNWLRTLRDPGEPDVYRGDDLDKIGMPVGGLCCGMLYLSGDGRLWSWDIFNRIYNPGTDGPNYARPLKSTDPPLRQGFTLSIAGRERPMTAAGWKDVAFTGTYPIGTVDYADPESPVTARLEAFSPFIPLNTDDSSLPVTVLRWTLTNRSKTAIVADLTGHLENAVCLHTARPGEIVRRNAIEKRDGHTFLSCRAEPDPSLANAPARPDIPFDDFERETYAPWVATGTAFGVGPVEISRLPSYMGPVDGKGKRVVNTHHFRNGDDVVGADRHIGTLTSPEFTVARNYVTFLVGGGNHPGKTCVNIEVGGSVVASIPGKNSNVMAPVSVDVRAHVGKTARIVVVDNETGGWGQIAIDDIVFSDKPRDGQPLPERHDFGTMGLALLGREKNDGGDVGSPIGRLTRTIELAPGASKTATFLVTWHFPNIQMSGLRNEGGRHYTTRFTDAGAVAAYVAKNADRLFSQTRLWRDTWYDSTLPRWFLDRTFASASTLATTTCYKFASGRFYAWEGVGCCEGTCTHVWHYAHAVARLFPDLERDLRERTDYRLAFDAKTGLIQHRGTHGAGLAVDGQAGIVLRTLREHQMSPDDAFLRRVWPQTKLALTFLMQHDSDADGILDGAQHNTYDAAWFGKIAWISGVFLAAVRAGEEMARVMGDTAFAAACRKRFEIGRANIDTQLFNGEFYVQQPDPDPATRAAVGSFDSCFADQVFGQSWANQVHLGRILDETKVKRALKSIWDYNFTPDIGSWRKAHPAGRWYAMPGEAGLVLANWPRKPSPEFKDHPSAWSAMYFNETWTGFEYQVAGHMLAEGMIDEGLAITRAAHDRYHPSRRNPYNEIECSDHYARAMAGYGVFIAACGYAYDGPRGHLAFAPKVKSGDRFRAAFTTAGGWGTFEQSGGKSGIALQYGRLRLKTLAAGVATGARVTVDGKPIDAKIADGVVTFAKPIELRAGQRLEISAA